MIIGVGITLVGVGVTGAFFISKILQGLIINGYSIPKVLPSVTYALLKGLASFLSLPRGSVVTSGPSPTTSVPVIFTVSRKSARMHFDSISSKCRSSLKRTLLNFFVQENKLLPLISFSILTRVVCEYSGS